MIAAQSYVVRFKEEFVRYLFSIVGIIALCAVIWLGSLAHKPSGTAPVSDIQPARINTPAINSGSHNIPAAGRAENIMISTSKAAAPADKLSERDAGRTYKREITAGLAPKPAPQPINPPPSLKSGSPNVAVTQADKEPRTAEKTDKPAETKTSKANNRIGNAANCKGYPLTCNWYDAMAYCGGLLPTVAQLKSIYRAECTEGRLAETCDRWYWSLEEEGADNARTMAFYTGNVSSDNKNFYGNAARCER